MARSDRMMWRPSIRVAALGACLVAATALAVPQQKTEHGQPVAWSNPTVYWQAEPQLAQAASFAAQAWRATCSAAQLLRAKSDLDAQVYVRTRANPWPWGQTEHAWTVLRADPNTGKALHGTIWLRDSDEARTHRRALLVHEFGHALGLAHVLPVGPGAAVDTVMLAGVGDRLSLGKDDLDALCAIYPGKGEAPPTGRDAPLGESAQPLRWLWLVLPMAAIGLAVVLSGTARR